MGVWNGWGYGIAIFRALNFQIPEPEIWHKSLLLWNFRDSPGKFGLWKIYFGLWKMAGFVSPYEPLYYRRRDKRATTVQHRFVLFFLLSFLLFCSPWAKALCFEGERPGGKIRKMCEKLWKSVKNSETILPFSCCPLVFLWGLPVHGILR